MLAVVFFAFVSACGLSRAEEQQIELWLTCDDCPQGERDSVVAMGNRAVSGLRRALEGPPQSVEQRARQVFGEIWAGLDNPNTDSAQYVERLLANYVALGEIRAAIALGGIGTSNAVDALQEALADDTRTYRDDVRVAIHSAIYDATGRVQWVDVSAGIDHSCGTLSNGRLLCWGLQDIGRLGNGTATSGPNPNATPVLSSLEFRSVSADSTHTCATTWDQRAFCWGAATSGQLGNGTDAGVRTRPSRVSTTVRFSSISAGGGHLTCGLTPSGEAYCWGDNRAGQLGVGASLGTATSPVQVSPGELFRQISVSIQGTHACAVGQDAFAHCWGLSSDGALGAGATTQSTTPEAVAGSVRFTAVSAGARHTCGLADTGLVYCWGSGEDGRLGTGFTTDANTPTPIAPPGTARFVDVSAGLRHTCAVSDDGRAFCWGYGDEGQLGDGLASTSWAPALVAGEHRWLLVRASDHTCGVTLEARLYCWGPGTHGEVGDGDEVNRNTPREVVAPSGR